MKVFSLVYFISWCTMCIFVSAVRFNIMEQNSKKEKFAYATAQCKAKCYAKYEYKLIHGQFQTKCDKEHDCFTCLNVCEDHIILNQEPECEDICRVKYRKTKASCMDSCNTFYNIIDHDKTWGNCSQKYKYNYRSNFCTDDWSCRLSYKCCSSSPWGKANKHCAPTQGSQDVGLSSLKISSITGTRSAKLSWSMSKEKKNIQFVVESKVLFPANVTVIGDEGWEYVGQTASTSFQLDYLQRKQNHCFRIGIVDKDGFLGYSKIISFKVPEKKRLKPSKPLSLTVTESKDAESLLISWKKPKVIVGKMIKYKLVYYKVPDRYSKDLAFIKKKIVLPSKTSTEIFGLYPNTKYQFVLFAVVRIGTNQVRGGRAKKIYETGNFKPVSITRRGASFAKFKDFTFAPTRSSIQIVPSEEIVNQTTYTVRWKVKDMEVNTLLLFWYTHNCKNKMFSGEHSRDKVDSKASVFVLRDLHENCHYQLLIRPNYFYGTKGQDVTLKFHTYRSLNEHSCCRRLETNLSFYTILLFTYLYLSL